MKQLIDYFFILLTTLGDNGYVWIAIILALLINKKTRTFGVLCGIALLSEFLINDFVLKNIIARERPFIQHNLELIIKPPSGYSMPSGHAASSFAVSGMFLFFKKKGRVYLLILATFISLSRVYLHVHFFTDILAGATLGLFVAWLVYKIYQKYTTSTSLA